MAKSQESSLTFVSQPASTGTELPGIGGGTGGGSRSEYIECVQGASTPVDLQNCAKKLQ